MTSPPASRFGRIYSIWDVKRRMFVYVGQTIRREDFNPHGRQVRKAWNNNPGRYFYCVERESESISQPELNRLEARFVVRRGTFNCRDSSPHGFNFTRGGGQQERSADSIKRQIETFRKNLTPERRNKLSQLHLGMWQQKPYRKLVISRQAVARSDPKFRATMVAAMAEVRKRPGFLESVSKSLKLLHQNPAYRELFLARMGDTDVRAKMSIGSKLAGKRTELKATRSQSARRLHSDANFKAAHRLAVTRAMSDPETKSRQKSALKVAMASTVVREKHLNAIRAYWAAKRQAQCATS